MFLDVARFPRRINIRAQRGFLIPVALVIVVGLSALAIAISSLSAQSQSSAFREVISAQSFYAAETGSQYAMNQLFYSVGADPSRSSVTAACASLLGVFINLNSVGLQNCRVGLSCTSSNDPSNTKSFFTVVSSAQCGSGELRTERSIQASAYIE